jgi:hypothetical protein
MWLSGKNPVSETPTGATETVALPGTRKMSVKRIRHADVRMAHGRDYTLLQGFSRCRFTGQRHGQGNGAPLVADGSEWFTCWELVSAAINGENREKRWMPQKRRNVFDRIFSTKSPRIGAHRGKGAMEIGFAGLLLRIMLARGGG